MAKETFFIIARGGYLKKPIVEKIIITDEDIQEILDDDGGMEGEDAVNEILSEACAEYNQGFSQTISLSEKEFEQLKKLMNKI